MYVCMYVCMYVGTVMIEEGIIYWFLAEHKEL